MNTFQLECFLAVADYLNFARAAEEMHISQPSVTHQIQALENELHIKLFWRTTRFVELTPEGLSFLEDAKSIVSISRRAVRRFENADDQSVMGLAVGCRSQFQLQLIEHAMEGIREVFPGVHPRIAILPGSQLLTCVEDGTLDVALSIKDPTLKKDPMVYQELQKVPMICICRENHPFAGRESVSAEEILREQLIIYHPNFAAPEVAKVQWKLLKSKRPSELHFCESPEAAVLLTQAGYGVSVLPDLVPRRETGLWKCRIEGVAQMSFGVYHRRRKESPLLRTFLCLLRDSIEA